MSETVKDILAKRTRSIQAQRDIYAKAGAEGRVLSAEERAQIDSHAQDALNYQERASEVEESGRIESEYREAVAQATAEEERVAKDQVAAAEDRQAFAAPNPQSSDSQVRTDENTHDLFMRWLRGDRSVFGTNEIGFKQSDLRSGAASVPAYRMVSDNEYRALSTGTADGGAGNTIPTPFIAMLYDYRETVSTARALGPTMLPTSGGEPYEWPYVVDHGIAANASDVPLPENTAIGGTDAEFGMHTYHAYKAGQLIPLSNEIIADTGVPLEEFIARDLGRGTARQEDRWFWLGTGTNMPQGITNGGFSAGSPGVDHEALDYPAIVKLLGSLDQSYGTLKTFIKQTMDPGPAACKWAMNPTTLVEVWQITDEDGRYMFQPMLSQGMHDTLCGYPLVTSTHIPALAAASTVMYFGSWSEAMVIREAGPTILRWSDDAGFAEDQRVYRITCRVDSKIRDTRAVRTMVTA